MREKIERKNVYFCHEGEKSGFWHSVKNVINEGCKGFLGGPRLIHRQFLSRSAAEGQKDDELTQGRHENLCNPSEMSFLTEGPETTLRQSSGHHFFPLSSEMSYYVRFLPFWTFFKVFSPAANFKKGHKSARVTKSQC